MIQGRPLIDRQFSHFQTHFLVVNGEFQEIRHRRFDEGLSHSLTTDLDYGEPPAAMNLEQVLDEDRAHALRFDAEIDAPPAFGVGQRVLTARHGHAGHTRLPQYARGRVGTINAYNGAHVFPDLSARGTEVHQHCYSVMFEAAELWPEAAGRRDRVYLDLWESYLERA